MKRVKPNIELSFCKRMTCYNQNDTDTFSNIDPWNSLYFFTHSSILSFGEINPCGTDHGYKLYPVHHPSNYRSG